MGNNEENEDVGSVSSDAPMPEHAFAVYNTLGKDIFAYATTNKKVTDKKTKKSKMVEVTTDTSKPPKVPPKLQHLKGELESQSTTPIFEST